MWLKAKRVIQGIGPGIIMPNAIFDMANIDDAKSLIRRGAADEVSMGDIPAGVVGYAPRIADATGAVSGKGDELTPEEMALATELVYEAITYSGLSSEDCRLLTTDVMELALHPKRAREYADERRSAWEIMGAAQLARFKKAELPKSAINERLES